MKVLILGFGILKTSLGREACTEDTEVRFKVVWYSTKNRLRSIEAENKLMVARGEGDRR